MTSREVDPAEKQTNFILTRECMGTNGTANARKSYLKCHKYPPNQFYLKVGRLKAHCSNSHGKRDKENVFLKEWCGEVFLRETRHQNVYDKSSLRKSPKCISLEVPMRKQSQIIKVGTNSCWFLAYSMQGMLIHAIIFPSNVVIV